MTKILTMIMVITSLSLFGQTNSIHPNGKKIVLNDNFTWSYEDEEKKENDNTNVDCEEVIIKSVDEFTGETYYITDYLGITSETNGLLIYWYKYRNSFGITSIIENKNCFIEASKAIVLFDDGTKIDIVNSSGLNCKGQFSSIIGNLKKDGQLFDGKNIKAIRYIDASNRYIDFNVPPQDGERLYTMLQCLFNS